MLSCSAASALSWEWASSRGKFCIGKVNWAVTDTDDLFQVWHGSCRNEDGWCHKVAVNGPVPSCEFCVRSCVDQMLRSGKIATVLALKFVCSRGIKLFNVLILVAI